MVGSPVSLSAAGAEPLMDGRMDSTFWWSRFGYLIFLIFSGLRNQVVTENDCLVVFFVARSKHQGDSLPTGFCRESGQLIVMTFQLGGVAAMKFLPVSRIVGKPASQLVGRCKVPKPGVELRGFSGNATWPDSIDQNTDSVVGAWFRVGAFQLDVGRRSLFTH